MEPRAAVNFDNVMTKVIINKRTDVQPYKKLAQSCFSFTITRPHNGQMPGQNEGNLNKDK